MSNDQKNIVVCCPNWVGDVIMATPTLRCFRSNFPKSRIFAVIRKYAYGVIENGPWFDEVITMDDKTLLGMIRLVRKIREIRPDMAIVLPNSFRSALIMRIAGVKNIYGYYINQRSFLLTGGPVPVSLDNKAVPCPMLKYYLEICRWLRLDLPTLPRPEIFISEAVQTKANQLLDQYGIEEGDLVIGFNPGAKFGSSKCWPPEYFAKLAELIEERWPARILLFVGPGEEDIAKNIIESSKVQIINTGPDQIDLSLLKPMIKRCQLLITNDTGPRHYAVALDRPVVVIMGSTDPRYTAANLEKTIVVRKDISCAPCHKKVCPYNHECMTSISPEEVMEAAERLIE